MHKLVQFNVFTILYNIKQHFYYAIWFQCLNLIGTSSKVGHRFLFSYHHVGMQVPVLCETVVVSDGLGVIPPDAVVQCDVSLKPGFVCGQDLDPAKLVLGIGPPLSKWWFASKNIQSPTLCCSLSSSVPVVRWALP